MNTLLFLCGASFLVLAGFAVHCLEDFLGSTAPSTPRRRRRTPRA